MSNAGGPLDTVPNVAETLPAPHRSLVMRAVSATLSIGLIILIYVWLRDQAANYGSSFSDVLRSLSALEALWCLSSALVVMLLSSVAMATPLRGISTGRAFVAQQTSTAVSNVIPGPSGTASRFAILYPWGVRLEDFTRGTIAVSLWNNVCFLAMPGLVFLVLALTRPPSDERRLLFTYGLAAAAVSAIVIGLAVGAVRSDRFVRTLGRLSGTVINALRRWVRRPPVLDLEGAASQLRARTLDVMHARKRRLTVVTLANYWLTGLLLITCLWFAGVPHSNLSVLVGLMLYSVGRLSTVIQVTPGGVGVVEVAYTAVFLVVIPGEYRQSVAIGVLLFRALTYVLPILTGAVCYIVWRVMRRRETRLVSAPPELNPSTR